MKDTATRALFNAAQRETDSDSVATALGAEKREEIGDVPGSTLARKMSM